MRTELSKNITSSLKRFGKKTYSVLTKYPKYIPIDTRKFISKEKDMSFLKNPFEKYDEKNNITGVETRKSTMWGV
jgi:hypothetical protein